jgi:hypothetical protein
MKRVKVVTHVATAETVCYTMIPTLPYGGRVLEGDTGSKFK